jgi:hypothetical protein
VLYLATGVGGPTVVTTMKLASPRPPRRSYLVHPEENAMVCFDGSVLHGVVPGRGVGGGGQRRVSLMVAFWDGLEVREGGGMGAARPWPEAGERGGGGGGRSW